MRFTITLIAGCGLFAALAFGQPPRYTVTDLGVVGGAPGQPFVIARNGLTAGTAVGSNNAAHAILWYKGSKADIGASGLGGSNSIAFSVNARGEAVGQAETSTPDPNKEDFCGFGQLGLSASGVACSAYIWQYGVMLPLTTLGGVNSVANGINNRGEIVGLSETTVRDPACPGPQLFQFKPTLWEHGNAEALPTVGGDPNGIAFAINDSGQAVGASGICSEFNPNLLISLQPLHALLWQEGSVLDIGNLGGTGHFLGNVAININNLGQVVGNSDLAGDQSAHAFLWSHDKGMQDLGTLPGDANSVSVGINDSGDVTGLSLDAEFNPRAFLRHNGVMYDLNSLISPTSPLYLMVACSINSSGEIIGVAIQKSVNIFHACMLTPSTLTTTNDIEASGSAEAVARPALSDDARKLLMEMRFGGYVKPVAVRK